MWDLSQDRWIYRPKLAPGATEAFSTATRYPPVASNFNGEAFSPVQALGFGWLVPNTS